MAGKHRAAADKYGRNVDSCCCHQKARYVFITVRDAYQGIKLMCHCHTLGGIGDQVTGNEGIFHSDVPHGDTVTDCDGREHDRCSACHGNAHFYSLCNFIQVHVTRYDLIVGAYDSYERFFHLFFGQTQRTHQRTLRCLCDSFFYSITSHDLFLFSYLTVLCQCFYQQISHFGCGNFSASLGHDIYGAVSVF